MAAFFSSEIRKYLGAVAVSAVALWLEPSAVRAQWLTVAAVGLLWIALPPRTRLPNLARWGVVGLLGLPLLALLPLGAWDADHWRSELAVTGNAFPLLTPQPWVVMSTLAGYAAAIAFAVWLFLAEWSERQRRGLAWALGGLALGAIGGMILSDWFGVASARMVESGLGPFPSRNQSGLFFAIGTLWWLFLAGQSAALHRQSQALVCALAAMVCGAMTVGNGSRAGVGFLAIGILLQCALGGWGMARGRRMLITSLLLVAAVLAFFGMRELPIFHRGTDDNVSFRQAVHADTLDLILDSPVVGIGLGNYDAVFAFYRTRSASEYRVRHAENDWLHAAAETGIPGALVLVTVWIGLLTLTGRRLLREPTPRTVTIAIALLLFAAHLLFDQSGHAPGMLFWLLLMVSLLFPIPGTSSVSRVRGRLIGAALLATAVALASWIVPRESAAVTAEGVDFRPGERPSLAELDEALATRPLSWNLHEMRAHQLAQTGRWDEAAAEFRLAEILEPFSTALAQREIHAFRRGSQPARTAAAIDELLRRTPVESRPGFLDSYLNDAAELPSAVEAGILDFRVIRWRRLDDTELRRMLAEITPPLAPLTAYAEARLAALAIRAGGLTELERVADRMGGLRPPAWRSAAEALAAAGDYRGADWIVIRYLLPDFPEETSFADRLRKWQTAPTEPAAAFALARAYLREGSSPAARRVIDHVPIRDETEAMVEFYRGWADYLEGKYSEAWNRLNRLPQRGSRE